MRATRTGGWTAQLARYGLLFVRSYLGAFNLASGLNFFLLVWPQPIPIDPLGAAYMTVTLKLHLFQLAKVLEIVGGACLLAGIWVPLGLVLLFPVSVTVFVMDTFFSPLVHVEISGARNFAFHVLLFAAYFGHYRGMLRLAAQPRPLWRSETWHG
jgi:putative oxidoreductase